MSIVADIRQVRDLESAGVISQEDFFAKKSQILSQRATLDDLAGLKELLDEGTLTQEEFFAKKKEALEAPTPQVQAVSSQSANPGVSSGEKSKVAAGLLGIFLGAFGAHKFYLGYQKEAIIMLCCSLAGIVLSFAVIGIFLTAAMSIIGLIEGIMYLVKSDEQFEAIYVQGQKNWF